MGMTMIGDAHGVTVGGTHIAWGELGQGTPLVLLHGLGDSHRTWRRVAPLLGRRFRLLMPDLPGHGRSGRPDAPYTLAWYAATVSAWMDELGVERAHVAGHSFGGGVAQWMLLEHRRRIDRLALVAAGGLGREVGAGLRLAALPLLGTLLAPPLIRLGTRPLMRLAAGRFANPEPEEIERQAQFNCMPGSGMAFGRTVAGCINVFGQYMQTWHRIHEIAELPPIALFWGERDPILPVRHGRLARRRLGDIPLWTFPSCGHFPHLECPAHFAGELTAFLTEPSACAPGLPAPCSRRS